MPRRVGLRDAAVICGQARIDRFRQHVGLDLDHPQTLLPTCRIEVPLANLRYPSFAQLDEQVVAADVGNTFDVLFEKIEIHE